MTLGVGAEVKRAAAIAVEAGIRACTRVVRESSAMLDAGGSAFGGDGLERDGGGGLGVDRARGPRRG